MRPSAKESGGPNVRVLLAYVADLELEVDRLRKQGQFLGQEATKAVRSLPAASAARGRSGPPPQQTAG